MGVRVTFHLGAPDGLEGLFWGAGPRSFLDWARYVAEEDQGTFSPELLRRLDRIVAEGPGRLVPVDGRDAEIIDEIFDLFVGLYCDTSARSLLKAASDRVVYFGWYRRAQPLIECRCSRRTSLCWEYLLGGRAAGGPPALYPYTPSDAVFRLGYWTADEVRSVHDDLRATFPAVALRGERGSRGEFLQTPDDEVAIEIAVEATAKALGEETGLITTVA